MKRGAADNCHSPILFSGEMLVTVATAATAATTAAESAATATTAAAASATKAAATTAASAAESTAGTGFLRTCFVYVESARADLCTIHPADRFICFLVIGHFHKSKTSRLACVTVLQNGNVLNLAVCGKCLAEFVFCNFEVQISYVDVLHEVLLRSKQARYGRRDCEVMWIQLNESFE